MSSLVDKVLGVHAAFADAGIDHAFGGALSLAYHTAEPRATRDIDVNVFLPATAAETAFAAMPSGVRWSRTDIDEVGRRGQVRLFWRPEG